jgi:hypothetical protein
MESYSKLSTTLRSVQSTVAFTASFSGERSDGRMTIVRVCLVPFSLQGDWQIAVPSMVLRTQRTPWLYASPLVAEIKAQSQSMRLRRQHLSD